MKTVSMEATKAASEALEKWIDPAFDRPPDDTEVEAVLAVELADMLDYRTVDCWDGDGEAIGGFRTWQEIELTRHKYMLSFIEGEYIPETLELKKERQEFIANRITAEHIDGLVKAVYEVSEI